MTVEAGQTHDLGTLVWTPVRYGRQVWEIGIPNRSAAEFRHGDHYWQWGLYNLYPQEFPNDVNYVVGKSDWSRDWNYAQPPRVDAAGHVKGTTWRVTFDLPKAGSGKATLRLALCGTRDSQIDVAVNGHPVGTTGPLPSSGVMHRDGIRGTEIESDIPFDGSVLVAGKNVLELTTHARDWVQGVLYDYLRLELEEPAANHRVLALSGRVSRPNSSGNDSPPNGFFFPLPFHAAPGHQPCLHGFTGARGPAEAGGHPDAANARLHRGGRCVRAAQRRALLQPSAVLQPHLRPRARRRQTLLRIGQRQDDPGRLDVCPRQGRQGGLAAKRVGHHFEIPAWPHGVDRQGCRLGRNGCPPRRSAHRAGAGSRRARHRRGSAAGRPADLGQRRRVHRGADRAVAVRHDQPGQDVDRARIQSGGLRRKFARCGWRLLDALSNVKEGGRARWVVAVSRTEAISRERGCVG